MSELPIKTYTDEQRKLFDEAKARLIDGIKKLPDEKVGFFNHVGATKGIKELQDQFNAELKKIKALGQE